MSWSDNFHVVDVDGGAATESLPHTSENDVGLIGATPPHASYALKFQSTGAGAAPQFKSFFRKTSDPLHGGVVKADCRLSAFIVPVVGWTSADKKAGFTFMVRVDNTAGVLVVPGNVPRLTADYYAMDVFYDGANWVAQSYKVVGGVQTALSGEIALTLRADLWYRVALEVVTVGGQDKIRILEDQLGTPGAPTWVMLDEQTEAVPISTEGAVGFGSFVETAKNATFCWDFTAFDVL